MSDGGVSEQSPYAGLNNGREVAEHHRGRSHYSDYRNPSGRISPPGAAAFCTRKTEHHHFGKDKKARHLGTRGNEGGAGSRGAFVGIGRPEMEGHGGDLEAEANDSHDNGYNQERVEPTAFQSCGDLTEIGCSR